MCKFNVPGLPASKPSGSAKQTLAAYDDEFLQFTYKVSLDAFAGAGAPVWGSVIWPLLIKMRDEQSSKSSAREPVAASSVS